MKERGPEMIWIRFYVSVFILREGPSFMFTGRVGHTGSTRPKDEEVVGHHGPTPS
jgi:hypothetical protein